MADQDETIHHSGVLLRRHVSCQVGDEVAHSNNIPGGDVNRMIPRLSASQSSLVMHKRISMYNIGHQDEYLNGTMTATPISSNSSQMPKLQPDTTLRFGDATALDSKAFTFVMEPHPHTAAIQDSTRRSELRGSVKRQHAFDELESPESKRCRPFVSPSNRDRDQESGCHTPYPAPKSESGPRSDKSDAGGCDFECYVHTTVKEHLENLIASIKRKVKDECEVALDTAWKEVVQY